MNDSNFMIMAAQYAHIMINGWKLIAWRLMRMWHMWGSSFCPPLWRSPSHKRVHRAAWLHRRYAIEKPLHYYSHVAMTVIRVISNNIIIKTHEWPIIYQWRS